MPDPHSERLLLRYLRNLRSKAVQVSFGNMFDNQSRFKVAPRKQEVKHRDSGSLLSFKDHS